MQYYSHKGSFPTFLPDRLVMSNGLTRTDRSTFTAEEIADAGYVEVSDPPEATYPNKVDWDGSNWIIKPPNEQETAAKIIEIREECVKRLTETDYKVIKAYEQNVAVDPAYVQYRQALRDLFNNIINEDPWTVKIPSLSEYLPKDPLPDALTSAIADNV